MGNEEKQEVKIEKEVRKRLDLRLAERAKSSTKAFRNEFKKQTLIAITAAFAFLIALTWRTPIQKSIDAFVVSLGIAGQAIYYEYLAAIIITLLSVIALMALSKWAIEKDTHNS